MSDFALLILLFVANGEPFCLETWGYAVDASARRAGLLLSGDLTAAASQLGREPRFTVGRPTRDKIADLIVHSVSPTHHRLRQKLGLAIAEDDLARKRRGQGR